MATSIEYVEFVCSEIRGYFNIRYKKMFGEYLVYVNEKPIFLVCDNIVYIKQLKQVEDLMANAPVGIPYNGSKEHYVLDMENKELVDKVVVILEEITPVPKKKSKK